MRKALDLHRLSIAVCSAHRLKLVNGRHNDPYALVRVGTTTLRTSTVVDGGSQPVWRHRERRHTPRTALGCASVPVLYDAADRGDWQEVKRALAAKCDVADAPKGRHGNTALHRAAANGHAAVVKELLRARADIDTRTDESWTAFHCACHSGQNVVVKLLCARQTPIIPRTAECYR